MLLYISVDLLWVDWPFSNSKGRSFVAIGTFQRSSLLYPYHSFHLVWLDVLVLAPFLDSVLVLFSANIKSVTAMHQKSVASLRSIKPMPFSHESHDSLQSTILVQPRDLRSLSIPVHCCVFSYFVLLA